MKKNKNNYFIFIILFFSFLLFFSNINANENKEFLTLKNIEVNLRQGPSFEYPIKLVYKKKYLPVIIIDKSLKIPLNCNIIKSTSKRRIIIFTSNNGKKFIKLESLGCEMFVTKNKEVLINEIAPRVHNSGHHTLQSSKTSQFEQHLRAILGLDLGSTK